MGQFVAAHQQGITGQLSCHDRVIFHGHLPIATPHGFAAFLVRSGVDVLNLKQWGEACRKQLVNRAKAIAAWADRPYLPVRSAQRQKDLVREVMREIIRSTGRLRTGVICVLWCLEMMRSFRLASKAGRVDVEHRRGLMLYVYRFDPEFGLLHTRIQTWAPFTAQVYLNGHYWLARQLRRERIPFELRDNVFTNIGDFDRAQQLADGFTRLPWVDALDRLMRPMLALRDPLLHSYYWCVDQAEYATDLVFGDREHLATLYRGMVRHSMVSFGCADVMGFLGGPTLNQNFKGQVELRCSDRWQGTRLRFSVKRNAMKVYDKASTVLRVETTVNDPADFKAPRTRADRGRRVTRWLPIRKSVVDFPKVQRIQKRANRRLLDAFAAVECPGPAHKEFLRTLRPVTRTERRYAGLQHLHDQQQALYRAVLNAGHNLRGFFNRDIRDVLFPTPASPADQRRRAASVTRKLQKLRAHGLIAKIPHTHRWHVTHKGLRVMSTALALRDTLLPQPLVA